MLVAAAFLGVSILEAFVVLVFTAVLRSPVDAFSALLVPPATLLGGAVLKGTGNSIQLSYCNGLYGAVNSEVDVYQPSILMFASNNIIVFFVAPRHHPVLHTYDRAHDLRPTRYVAAAQHYREIQFKYNLK